MRGSILVFVAACGASEPPAKSPARPPACPSGDVVVHVDEDAALLKPCRVIEGDLIVGPSFALGSLVGLDRVERVAGSLELSNNAAMGGLFLPGLRQVGGDLTIESNLSAETVSLHHLEQVGGDLVVRDNRALLRLDLGALRQVRGRLVLADHPALESVSLDALADAGELAIADNPAWPAEEIAALRARVTR
jgi:hypothetical protein